MKGVDISHYQQGLTIQQLKQSGKDFAILKITEGTNFMDACAFDFYKEAYETGFPVGAYCYSHAINAQQAMAEAKFLLDRINKFPMPCGIFIDIETEQQLDLPAEQLKQVILGWCAAIGGAGYLPGVYSSEGTLWSKVSPEDLPVGTLVWVAKWSNTQPKIPCDIWQNSDNGRIEGYDGPVDTDVALSDRFQYLITNASYNRGESQPEEPEEDLAPDACHIQSVNPVISVLQLLMSNQGYWSNDINGIGSDRFFNSLQRFVDDLREK